MESLKSVANVLRKQLAEIEAKMSEIEKPVDIREKVLKMRSSKKWKEFVNECGVIENVVSLMEESHGPLHDNIDGADKKKVKSILGHLGSDKWNKFIVKVFEHMVKEGTFDNDDGTYENFEDTEGGCDEILWDICVDVLDGLLKNGNKDTPDE